MGGNLCFIIYISQENEEVGGQCGDINIKMIKLYLVICCLKLFIDSDEVTVGIASSDANIEVWYVANKIITS